MAVKLTTVDEIEGLAMPPLEFQQLLSWALSVWFRLPWSLTSTVVVFAIPLFAAALVWLDHDREPR